MRVLKVFCRNSKNYSFFFFAVVLSESVPADIDKVLLGLEAKEFTIELSTLQSLQQLNQWVADLALNILAKLPDNRGMIGIGRNIGVRAMKYILKPHEISMKFSSLSTYSTKSAKTLSP